LLWPLKKVDYFPLIIYNKFMGYAILTIIIVLLMLIIFFMRSKDPKTEKGKLTITSLSDQHKGLTVKLLRSILPPKTKVKLSLKHSDQLVYVLEFKGSLQAKEVENLRQEITAILAPVPKFAKPSEVIVKLDSPGGTVTGYGLAAAQLGRLKKAGIPVTVAVDQVAASGGYMMAAVADKIVAAPFAIIGSVGVVMELPNFAKLLERAGIKYLQYTAGEHKRPVSPMVEPTKQGEEKTQEKLVKTLELFKNHIKENRPQVDVEAIATGETWYATEAKDLKMVDQVMTYDEYLEDKLHTCEVFKVVYEKPEKLSRKLSLGLASTINLVVEHWVEKISTKKLEP
jgi:serine protease SohB